MQIYLPIADLPVNAFTLLGLGAAVGFVSGMFGVGGGFLMTPFLIFLGIPTGVAVASSASHMTASSFSATLNYWRKRTIDLPMALVLLGGGMMGTLAGVWLFTVLKNLGQLDFFISVSYLLLLSGVGALLIVESVQAIWRTKRGKPHTLRKGGAHGWAHRLPVRLRFRKSRIYVSVFPVWAIGFLIGVAGAVMGIGGGFILVPILIYYLRMPTATVIGTAAMLTTATMALSLVTQAITNHLVDVLLALLLMIGGVVGAQFGSHTAHRLPAERLRFLLGALVIAVALRLGYGLITPPANIYSLTIGAGA